MSKLPVKLLTSTVVLFTFILSIALLAYPTPAASDGGQIVSGPFSLTVRGGSYSDSATMGFDARGDFINPFLNLHLFGTFDQMDASSGIGAVDSQRYGAGFALSHTYPGKANIFFGTSFINELDEYFGHAYLGGKVKVSDNALLSASYGVGLGPDMQVTKNLTKFLTAKSADWVKAGAVYVGPGGIKTNLYYYITDPGGERISGVEGQLSYPVSEAITAGVVGNADLSVKTDIDRDWRGQFFVAYAFGGQMGAPIDVALDKNNPIAYPMVIRSTGARAATSGTPLSISPTATSAYGCSTDTVTFTASGGTGSYAWSTSEGGSVNLTEINSTQAQWFDGSDNFCSTGGTVTITVSETGYGSASAVITVLVGG